MSSSETSARARMHRVSKDGKDGLRGWVERAVKRM